MGPHTGWTILFLVCSVQATNYAPEVQNGVHNLCEDLEIGDHAFDISASDPEGDPLTYKLSGLQASVFRVDSATGRVTLAGALDRETEAVLTFQAHANDRQSEAFGTITIIVLDANDNRPVFQYSSYDTSVPENAQIGRILITVHATDADTGAAGAVKYNIDEVSPAQGANLFDIGAYNGEVTLRGHLNYTSLSPFYRLKINATDGGGQCGSGPHQFQSNSMFSLITVEDVPDLDPIFMNIPPALRVEENSPIDLAVYTVIAIDQDKGINDGINYSIEDSKPAGLFKISPDDGVITVLSEIDREVTGDTVTLTLKATEKNVDIHGRYASTTETMQITIVDINDNPPEFYDCSNTCVKKTEFTGEVLEHYTGSISFNMTVKDPDRFVNTKLTLEGADKEVFSVEPSTTTSDNMVQLRVRQPAYLDFEEKQQMVLQIIAEDMDEPSFHTTATVTINIKDDNDNSPAFPEATYELEVPEHSPDGTTLDTITAEDPDTMDQGKLTYKLLPESILNVFDVDPVSGTVYVKNGAVLDRESRSLYTVTLQARDTGNKPGSTVLEITLTDINDQPPVINRDSYLEYVREASKFEIQIEATDRDDPDTVNSQILYSIEPSKFSNSFTLDENTGWLRNKGELDREALDPELNGRIELNVTATDKGIPPLSSTVPFVVIVEDINDNAPKFEATYYSFSVKEGEKGAFVGFVHAVDLDQTNAFNRISFSISSGGFGSFGIVANQAETGTGYNGKISVDQDVELDFEAERNTFELQVEAVDPDRNKDITTVRVTVLDVNDERPEFEPMDPVTVKENTTINDPVGKFKAQDKDTNHSLTYKQESVNCRCNNTMRSCQWFILDPNGDVRVNPKDRVDYEECDQTVIEAQVVDEYTEKGENNSVKTGQMLVYIEDINDNIPHFFNSDSVNVVVAEGSNKGTSVASVTASDKDSGKYSEIVFKVKHVQFEHINNHTEPLKVLFDVVTTQQGANYVGLIQSSEGLDITLRGKYLVTVTATDTGGLEATTVVEIFTVDESFKVELEFKRSEAEVVATKDEIKSALMSATGTAVEIVEIRAVTRQTPREDVKRTIIVAYFIYRNGSALTHDEVESMLSVREHFFILNGLGLSNIGKFETETKTTSPLQYALLGVVAGLVIVLAVLTTSLMCTRRSYKRKLKAAKAMNTASAMNSDNQKGGAVVPGTNKYTMEGANPVLNLALDIDRESSSDMDKASLNSLDDNYDMITSDTNHDMHRIEEEEEDDGPPEYKEPLDAALAQLGPKKTPKTSSIGFTNPIFDTTDL